MGKRNGRKKRIRKKKKGSNGGLLLKGRNYIRKKVCPKGTTPLRKGETHGLCMNYMGPGTDAENRVKQGIKGINSADRASMRHDMDYNKISRLNKQGRLSKKQIKEMTRKADKRMLSKLKKDRKAGMNKTMLDKFSTFVGGTGIRAKILAEKIGVLDPGKFST